MGNWTVVIVKMRHDMLILMINSGLRVLILFGKPYKGRSYNVESRKN